MSLDTLRSFLKKIPFAKSLGIEYRALKQTRIIERDQKEYEQKAKVLSVEKELSFEEIQGRINDCFVSRGIKIKQKKKDELHIVYASRPTFWDAQNIVPALKKYANVSTYLHMEHGYDDYRDDWIIYRDDMNSHFYKYIKKLNQEHPVDLLLTYYSGYQITTQMIEKIKALGIVVVAIHLDDRLSFKGRFVGGRWTGPVELAGVVDLYLTQAPESLIKYRAEGGNVMLWPLAANQDLFYPRNVPFKYDISFLGSADIVRKAFLKYLERSGINVKAFGDGWPNGFIANEKVPELFSSSRINLNFGNIGYTHYQCGKCRDYEIPMSGGLMLTTHNEHLRDSFEIDKEIFTFKSKKDCVRQIRRLLNDKELCENARKKAQARALNEHKWENRIELLLQVIGYIV